jgi:hypothetical protein
MKGAVLERDSSPFFPRCDAAFFAPSVVRGYLEVVARQGVSTNDLAPPITAYTKIPNPHTTLRSPAEWRPYWVTSEATGPNFITR